MSLTVSTDPKMSFKLIGIELLNSSLILPTEISLAEVKFNIIINIESKIDKSKKLIFIIVSVDIKTEDNLILLGSIAVSCIYEIENFDEVVNFSHDQPIVAKDPLDLLNAISISTTRGVMFSFFKGTFLHNAILPIVDPSTLTKVLKNSQTN